MERDGRVRGAVRVDGLSQRAAAREAVSREVGSQAVAFAVRPWYRRQEPVK